MILLSQSGGSSVRRVHLWISSPIRPSFILLTAWGVFLRLFPAFPRLFPAAGRGVFSVGQGFAPAVSGPVIDNDPRLDIKDEYVEGQSPAVVLD